MIKKILLLLIFVLGFIGFSNAGYIGYIGQLQNSAVNTSYKVQVNGQGNLLTQYFGAGKRLLQFQDGVYFFWGNSSLPYIYITSDYSSPNNHSAQGFVNDYMICDFIGLDTGNVSSPQNCTRYNINSLSGFLGRYLNTLGNGGYYYYDTYSNNVPARNVYCGAFTICFSNKDFDNSLCFYGSNGNWGFPCDYSLSYPYGLYGNVTNLSNSLGLDPYFDNINSSVLGSSPGQYDGGGNINGSSQNVTNSDITGNVTYSTCTNSKALSYYKIQGYNDKLCYSSYGNNTDIYSSPGSVSDYSLTGLDISEVWMDTAGYRRYGNTGSSLPYNDWFQYWRKSFEVYNNSYNSSGTVSNPFVGVPVSLFTLFGNVYSYGLAYNNQSIIEYCDLLLFTNLNNPYEGILGDLPCNYSAIDILADTIGLHADSGEVVKGSSWEGILNRSGYHLDLGRNSGSVSSGNSSGLSYFGDGKSFINNSFNLLSDSFRFPDRDSRGIIPSYILVFMFALILFRFISH